MATLNTNILAAAHADRLLPSPLTATQRLYLHPTVITANRVYWSIAESGDRGLDLAQLEQAIGIHYNTLTQFCRWLVERDLIYIVAEGEVQHRPANVYYASKEENSIMTNFTATIKKDEHGLFWLYNDRDGRLINEVFTRTEDETEIDMTMAGYRKLTDDFYIQSDAIVPESVTVEV